MIILLAAAILVGLAFALLLRAAVLPRLRTAGTIETIDGYGYAVPQVEAKKAAGRGARVLLDDVAGFVGALVGRRFGGVREEQLRTELMAAGLYAMPARRFLGYRILCMLSVPIVWVWLAATAGYPLLIGIVGVIGGLLAGWQAPLVIVRKRARRRLERIDFETPELIDVLVVTVEAGLGLGGSLQIASERLTGPLGDELRLALQQQNLGLPTDVALRNMLERANTPAIRSFVRSVIQGESLGVSTGDIMRNLAIEMRKRRRAAAEERAQKAPIKVLFPLVLLIFPAMFVVLLAPAGFQFIKAFGG